MKTMPLCLLLLFAHPGPCVSAQTYVWTTLAGPPPDFVVPGGIAVDRAGTVFGTAGTTVVKITSTGIAVTLAGKADERGSSDGVGPNARFNNPTHCAVDTDGNLYVADNCTVRKVTPTGVVTTLAGRAGEPGTGDGPGSVARLGFSFRLAVDRSGHVYVSDRNYAMIRKITPDGVVSTLAGRAHGIGSADGMGAEALFSSPDGVAVDGNGTVYVADRDNQIVRRITASGIVSTIAGVAGMTGEADGIGAHARFDKPAGITVDSTGNLFVCDTGSGTIRKITPDGTVSTIGQTGRRGTADGAAGTAQFYSPGDVSAGGDGLIYVVDYAPGHLLRTIAPDGYVSTILQRSGSADGVGSQARFNRTSHLAVDGAGNVYVADAGSTLRKITPGGIVTTLAGVAGSPGIVDGSGDAARLWFTDAGAVAIDPNGTLLVVNHHPAQGPAIRRITLQGEVTTIARDTTPFLNIGGLAVDRDGTIYTADCTNHVIKQVTSGGTFAAAIGTVVTEPVRTSITFLSSIENVVTGGYLDGAAVTARFRDPRDLAFDMAGNLYALDAGNSAVRKINPARQVSTIAIFDNVTPPIAYPPFATAYSDVSGMTVDGEGNVFVLSLGKGIIRKITPAGLVTTVGSSFAGLSRIAVDRAGNLYVTGGDAIRKGRLVFETVPIIRRQPTSLSVATGNRVVLSVDAEGENLRYQWQKEGVNIPGATSATYAIANLSAGDRGNYGVTIVNGAGSVSSTSAALTLGTGGSRMTNLSVRSQTTPGDGGLIVGFSLAGTGTKRVFLRGVGPALAAFGVTGVLSDPTLRLDLLNGALIGQNDNWEASGIAGGAATLAATAASVGAFALPTASRDAVLLSTLNPGSYTAQIGGGTGVALLEAYEVGTEGGPRLVNVSARTRVGSAGDVMIAGFVIVGDSAKTVMIRAIGPTLAQFGVASVLADPILELFALNGPKIFGNDDWRGDSALAGAFAQTGAFALSTASKDAALLVTLPPGGYTAQVSGVGGTSGVALVEIYDLDP